jgi:NTE family protein
MKTGLVLSGGGVRGIAHLGVLKALSDAGLHFCQISGTSAGSMVGALFAQGHEPDVVFEAFKKIRLLRLLRSIPSPKGLFSIDNIRNILLEYLPHDSFEKLKIPLTIAATNFSEGKLEYFTSGSLITAIQASCAIPGVFKPVMIGDKMYVDGGLLNNFPIEPLLDRCDFIIGSSCNNLPAISTLNNLQAIIQRAIIMSINADMKQKQENCDVLIEPKGMGTTSIFETGKAEEIFWIAYEETLKKLKSDEKLKEIVRLSNISAA